MSSRFDNVVQLPPIEVFELTRQFNESTHPNKVNLGVGGKQLVIFLIINSILTQIFDTFF
jgi:hypothetical protein